MTPAHEVRMLLVDPELGEHGLGLLAAHLPACEVWAPARVPTMQAAVQADAVLAEIQAAGMDSELVVGHGAGATVAAGLLAAGRARRVLLIDPLDHLTHDAGFEQVFAVDHPPPGPTDPVGTRRNIDRITTAIKALRAGDLHTYYQWVVDTSSDRPEIRQAHRDALWRVDRARQPYDESLGLTSERWAELDWLATLRRCPAAAVEIWLSRRPGGRELAMTAGYLRRELAGARVTLRPWPRYGFLVDPQPWARALRAR